MAVLVDGETVVDEALGRRREGGGDLRPGDRVPWLCASKSVLALAAVQVLDGAAVPLSTPVEDLLPGFAAGGKHAVQVRHLLDHTAGFRRTGTAHDYLWRDRAGMLRASLDAPVEPGWVPGRDGGYHHSTAWFVVAALVERLAGRPYDELVDDLALGPAGLRGVVHGLGSAAAWAAADLVVPHRRLWDGRLQAFEFLRDGRLSDLPPWGVAGPVSQLARLMDHLRRAGRGEAGNRAGRAAAAMVAPSWTGHDRTFAQPMAYGLGLRLDLGRIGFGARLPRATFGHAGWDCTVGLSVPGLGMSVGLFLNGGPTAGGAFRYPELAAPFVDAVVDALGGRGRR